MSWLAFCLGIIVLIQSGIAIYLVRALVRQNTYLLSISVKHPPAPRKRT